jgi:glycosyltransferase domain-containing protein
VPTYGRPRELARLLHFLDRAGNRSPVLILDGSDAAQHTQNLDTVRRHPAVAISSFDPKLHLGRRIAQGLDQVRTPYVVLCPDDDFVFPAGLEACARFLDANQDFSAAIGRYRALYYSFRLPALRRGFAFLDVLRHGDSLVQDRFLQRILFYLAYTQLGFVPLFYSLRRTAEARETFSAVHAGLKYSSMELLSVALLLAAGKAKVLPVPFGLRDYSSSATRDPERDDAATYFGADDLEYIRKVLAARLSKADALPDGGNAQEAVDLVLTLPFGQQKEAAPSCRLRERAERVEIYLQALLTLLLPRVQARCANLDWRTFAALRSAQAHFHAGVSP